MLSHYLWAMMSKYLKMPQNAMVTRTLWLKQQKNSILSHVYTLALHVLGVRVLRRRAWFLQPEGDGLAPVCLDLPSVSSESSVFCEPLSSGKPRWRITLISPPPTLRAEKRPLQPETGKRGFEEPGEHTFPGAVVRVGDSAWVCCLLHAWHVIKAKVSAVAALPAVELDR